MTESYQFEYGESEGVISKKEINGNTYIVATYYQARGRHKHAVFVWADTRTGGDHGMVDHPNKMPTQRMGYENLVAEKVPPRDDRELDKIVSQAVNRAVCEVEDKLEEEQENLDMVEAALEANAKIHGGIEYELEQNT